MRWIVTLMLFSMLTYGNEIASYQPYQGAVKLEFLTCEEGFFAQIETNDLILRSVSWEDYGDYVAFFERNQMNVSEESLVEILKVWVGRWDEGCDPYSALSIFKKEDEEDIFIGYIALDYGAEKGYVELKMAIDRELCGLECAKQAAISVLQEYATLLHTLNFYANLNHTHVLAFPFQHVHAMVRADDDFLENVFVSSGLFHYDEEIIDGTFLKHYMAPIAYLHALSDQKIIEESYEE